MSDGTSLKKEAFSAFGAVFENDELFEKMVDCFPYPVQVFSTDGTAIMINRAAVTMMDLPKERHVGVYNVFRDPIVREMGILDQVRQVLDGKTLTFTDVVTPYQDMVRRFHAMDSDIRTIHVDITCFPVFRSDGAVGCFVTVFLIKNAYRGKDGISCGKAYIEAHWREKFDAESVARAANLSVHHFSRLFKKHMGQTPHEYYTAVRVRRLQERLRDEGLTVSEAFAACGVDYHGHFSRVFRQKTGLTPTQYRREARQNEPEKP